MTATLTRVVLGLVLVLPASVVANATTLGGAASQPVAAGNASIGRCDADGQDVGFVESSGMVTAVEVRDIEASPCAGGAIDVTVASSAGAALATGRKAWGGGAVETVSITPSVAPGDIAATHVLVEDA